MSKRYINIKGKRQRLDPNFDPDDWEQEMLREDATQKMAVGEWREEYDISMNAEMMDDVLKELRTKPHDLFERFMRIEAEAAGLSYDDMTDTIRNADGSEASDAVKKQLEKTVGKLMVIRNPQLDQFPEYAKKAIMERA
tara:strand:- start:35334 stop:35750 length:417 start_codon:yes stop_codon:yes gene_type:complete